MGYFPESIMPPNRKDESQDVRNSPYGVTALDYNKHDAEIIAVEKYIGATYPQYAMGFSGIGSSGFSSFSGFSNFSGFSAFSGAHHLGETGDSSLDLVRFVVEALQDIQANTTKTLSGIVALKDPAVPSASGYISWPSEWSVYMTTLSEDLADTSVEDAAAIAAGGEEAIEALEVPELEIGDTTGMPDSGYITLINSMAMKRANPLDYGFENAGGFSISGTANSFTGTISLPTLFSVNVNLVGDIDGDFNNKVTVGSTFQFGPDAGPNAGKKAKVAGIVDSSKLRLESESDLESFSSPFGYTVFVIRTADSLTVDSINEETVLNEADVDFTSVNVQPGMVVYFDSGLNEGRSAVVDEVGGSALSLVYDGLLIPDSDYTYRIEAPVQAEGTIGGFSGLFLVYGFSGFSGFSAPVGFSSTYLPQEVNPSVIEQKKFDKAIAPGTNVEILHYRGISGDSLIGVSREKKGSFMGSHRTGDLVFKGELSITATPSLWVADLNVPGTDDDGMGHVECFVTPEGQIKLASRVANQEVANQAVVLEDETSTHAYAQFQAVLVRSPSIEPRLL